jgi:predicted metal-dependent hydrolase
VARKSELLADPWLTITLSNGRNLRLKPVPSARARRLRLTVCSGGVLRLTVPPGARLSQLERFVGEHEDWVLEKLAELREAGAVRPPLRVGVPDRLNLRGASLPLSWRQAALPSVRLVDERRLEVRLPELSRRHLPLAQGLIRSFLQGEARRDAGRLLNRYVPRVGRAPVGLAVRPLRSLWGSLSAGDRMSLDLSLVLAPPQVFAYVVVHELCHLYVRDHSPRFWSRVAEHFPAVDTQRAWLRQHGLTVKAEMGRLIGLEA